MHEGHLIVDTLVEAGFPVATVQRWPMRVKSSWRKRRLPRPAFWRAAGRRSASSRCTVTMQQYCRFAGGCGQGGYGSVRGCRRLPSNPPGIGNRRPRRLIELVRTPISSWRTATRCERNEPVRRFVDGVREVYENWRNRRGGMLHTIHECLCVTVSEAGAEACSNLARTARSIYWQGDGAYWRIAADDLSLLRQGAGRRISAGRQDLPDGLHGFAPTRLFRLRKDGYHLALELTDSAETRGSIRARLFAVRFRLVGYDAEIRDIVENRDEKNDVFRLGRASGFNCRSGPRKV